MPKMPCVFSVVCQPVFPGQQHSKKQDRCCTLFDYVYSKQESDTAFVNVSAFPNKQGGLPILFATANCPEQL